MDQNYLDDPTVLAVCEICRQAVRPGQDAVSIARNLEHIESDGNVGTVVTVKDSVVLAILCASCGLKYPEGRIRVVFE